MSPRGPISRVEERLEAPCTGRFYPARMNPGVGECAWPFVGRDAEVARVAEASSGALLAGSSGIGKSRLLAEAVARIPPDDHRIVQVAATQSLAAVPFGAFAGVLACDLDPGAPFTALSRAL